MWITIWLIFSTIVTLCVLFGLCIALLLMWVMEMEMREEEKEKKAFCDAVKDEFNGR